MNCPKCGYKLYEVSKIGNPDNPEYWFCYSCIKGYTNEELTNPPPSRATGTDGEGDV